MLLEVTYRIEVGVADDAPDKKEQIQHLIETLINPYFIKKPPVAIGPIELSGYEVVNVPTL